jgi:RND family efflux transporter MFP subunit
MTKRLLIVIPLAIGFAGCGEAPKETPAASSAPAVAVSTVTAATETWPSIYEATGTVRARSSATISAKLMGYVREVKVEAGERVREGQVLVTLDTRDLDVNSRRAEAAREEVRTAVPEADSAVAAAKADLDLAQVTFGRMQDLFQKKSLSDQEFDEASARLKAAQAAYDIARARRVQMNSKLAQVDQEVRSAEVARSYADVVAPFAGLITAKSVEPGNLALPGTPLLTIEREGTYRLEAAVEESHLAAIRVGQPVSVTLDSIDHPIEARISRDRARGGRRLAGLHSQDRSACAAGITLGRLRARVVPTGKPAAAGDSGRGCYRARTVAIGSGRRQRCRPHAVDHSGTKEQ